MDYLIGLFSTAAGKTLLSLSHNWPYLLASIIAAAALKSFADADRLASWLRRYDKIGVLAAVAAAVATPLCSCGTTAIVLGMMASTMPWAPIVAFMVSSPLSSPEGILYSAGLFGWPFAIVFFAASILIGLAGGAAASFLEKRGFLAGQARFEAEEAPSTCGCASEPRPRFSALRDRASKPARGLGLYLGEFWSVSRRILPIFVGFAFLGYLINGLVPSEWIGTLFGPGRVYGVPLAATIGLPLYINAEASMPLARALLDSGMSGGAIMAFLIAGAGTSVGAIAGALTIARWRVVGLVVFLLWAGAIAAGYGFEALAALGIV